MDKVLEKTFMIESQGNDFLFLDETFENCFGSNEANGDYIDCSTTNGTFEITLYVDQPSPGSRDTYSGGFTGPPDVGHTFLSASHKSNGSEKTIVFGFYPLVGVSKSNLVDDPKILNDGNHAFDVSATYTVTCEQFNDFLYVSERDSKIDYDLQVNNYSDFAVKTINSSLNQNIPDRYGVFFGSYGGSNCGDLAEDLRNLSPKMNLTIDYSGGSAPNSNCN